MQKDVRSKVDGLVNSQVDRVERETGLLYHEGWAWDGEVKQRFVFGCFT